MNKIIAAASIVVAFGLAAGAAERGPRVVAVLVAPGEPPGCHDGEQSA